MTSSSDDGLLSPIEHPHCTKCRTRMNLASLAPGPDGSQKRTFDCAHCGLVEIRIVDDPLASEQVRRLADNIRPPS